MTRCGDEQLSAATVERAMKLQVLFAKYATKLH